MKYYGFVILLGVFCLSSALRGKPSTEAPMRQHFPANIHTELPDLPPEIQAENDLMVNFAISCLVPEEYDDYTEEEKASFIEENFQRIAAVLKEYPDSSAALDVLSNLLDHPQYHEKLLAQLQALVDQGIQSEHLYFLYLITLDICQREQAFAEFLPSALKQYPDTPELLLMGLKFYAQENDTQKMDELLAHGEGMSCLTNQPLYQIIHLRRLLETGHEQDAEKLTAEIAQNELFWEHPEKNASEIWKNLIQAKGYQEVAVLYTALLDKDGKYLDPAFTKDIFYWTTLAACAAKKYDIVAQLLDCLNQNVSDKQLKRDILFDIGNVLHDISTEEEKKGGIHENVLQLDILIGREIRKNLPVIYVDDNNDRIIAKYLIMGGEYEEALGVLRHIRTPDSTDHFYIASMLMELGKYQEALSLMRQLAKTQADTPKAPFFMTLGFLEDKCGNLEESDEALKKALEMEPKFPRAANFLGYSWAVRGIHLDEAEKLIRTALEAEPENSAYQDSMAWVKFKKKELNEALRWMAKAFHDLDTSKDYQDDKATNEEMSEHLKKILHGLHCDYLADFY